MKRLMIIALCFVLAGCSGFCSGIGSGGAPKPVPWICPNAEHWHVKQIAKDQVQDLLDFKRMMNANATDHGKPIPYPEVEPK